MTARPIYGSRLITTAEQLAGVGAGRGRPALSDLRRATSTAYYGLFHQIVRHGAFVFLPGGTEDEIADVARWFTHAGIKDAADLLLRADSSAPLRQIAKRDQTAVMAIRSAVGLHRTSWSSTDRLPEQLVVVADAFQSLQEARHRADYDGKYDPVRAVTVNHIDDASVALKAAQSLWHAGRSPKHQRKRDHAGYRTFLLLAMLKSGAPKGR